MKKIFLSFLISTVIIGSILIYVQTKPDKTVPLKLNYSKASIIQQSYLKLEDIQRPFNATGKIIWESSNPDIAKVNKNGRVYAETAGNVTITATIENTLYTAKCDIEVKKVKYIAITFDDGPSYTQTPLLLDGLKKRNVKATFFFVGYQINQRGNRKIVKRISNEGHELGNHSYSHADFTTLSKSAFKNNFKKTDKMIYKITGKHSSVFRPPYGAYNQKVLKNISRPFILWTVDPEDWKYQDADKIAKSIVKSAKENSIILVHDLYPTSVKGALKAIGKLKKRGYKFVTVSELMEYRGIKMKDGQVYGLDT